MTLRPLRTKTLLIFWLRFAAWVLDELDKPHNLRRRLGQLQRVRGGSGASSVITKTVPSSLSVMPEVANQCDGCARGLPTNAAGNHTKGGLPIIGCTASLYGAKP